MGGSLHILALALARPNPPLAMAIVTTPLTSRHLLRHRLPVLSTHAPPSLALVHGCLSCGRSVVARTQVSEQRLVKVCGVTNVEDALAVASAGANLIGVIFADGSPRK